jgi:hypothetical protein
MSARAPEKYAEAFFARKLAEMAMCVDWLA